MDDPFYTPQVRERPPIDTSAIDLLIQTRPRILKIKLAILAAQIEERLRLRLQNQEKIARQIVEASSQLIPFRDPVHRALDDATRRFWHEQESRLEAEARLQDCQRSGKTSQQGTGQNQPPLSEDWRLERHGLQGAR